VFLPDSRETQIHIVNQPGILGGQVLLFACPTCGLTCRVLRLGQAIWVWIEVHQSSKRSTKNEAQESNPLSGNAQLQSLRDIFF